MTTTHGWTSDRQQDEAIRAILADDGATIAAQNVATVREMAAELRDLPPEASQHEALLRARWGADFRPRCWHAAVALVEYERSGDPIED